MKKLFSNILVPVDVNTPSEFVIREAIELARPFECNVHLLFMLPDPGRRYTNPASWFRNDDDINQRILKLYSEYILHLPPPLRLYTAVEKGRQETSIINYAIKNHIDLIILGRAPQFLAAGWFMHSGINRLSKKTGCPVLTLQSRANLDSVRNIVMPVGSSFLPIRKLMFATYLAKKYNSRLHLVTLSGNQPDPNPDSNAYLLKAYRLIRDNTEVPVECRMLPGENIATMTLQYARDVKADLIVINPGKESLLS
ncbi:MAG: universal stress protein, partial [Bacteroidetes bacterium]|nr:universal stress protein [Bacteroidota bacterium]